MPWFRKNIISNQVIKYKSDKLSKPILRDARKSINKEELLDNHDFALYLSTIDASFSHIKADIHNASRVINYSKVRADKLAETRKLLDFFNQDYVELDRLSQIVAKKAEQANRVEDFKHQKKIDIDLTELKRIFDKLMDKDKKAKDEDK